MTIEYLIQLRITTQDLEPWPEEVLDRLRQLDYIKEAELLEYAPNTRCDSCQQLKEVEEYHSVSTLSFFPLHVLLCAACWQELHPLTESCRLLYVRLHPCGCGG